MAHSTNVINLDSLFAPLQLITKSSLRWRIFRELLTSSRLTHLLNQARIFDTVTLS